ncbi:hypothetical protein [Roseinatronobacter sp. NSM]|uniref:hypothetical protein n=1 Tax=Roseinatronobacter sp. NSM TaxID=3457785 RepID=UPI004035DFFD
MTIAASQMSKDTLQQIAGNRASCAARCRDDVLNLFCDAPCTCLAEHAPLTDWLLFQSAACTQTQ